ncbi:uncharacterized protein [Rutidosis leptorrhynchoides]|uniref:uncharacterized protein n=1 Tax=Rutidosis leptorrhynchoides TaxID=125765 RepID=UPI003A98F975
MNDDHYNRVLIMDDTQDTDTEEEDETEEEEESEEETDEESEETELDSSVRVSRRTGISQVQAVDDSNNKLKSQVDSNDSKPNSKSNSNDNNNNGLEIDGLCCPICMEAWTNVGQHQISCLPCGHIFGYKCISKWLRQSRSSAKCPQCNRRCTTKDVRVLYASRLCVVDAELQKQVRSLEAKCASLEQKLERQNIECCKKEVEAQEREADLHLEVQKLTKKAENLERLLERTQRESQAFNCNQNYQSRVINACGVDNGSGSQTFPGIFALQGEFRVDGGRYFDMDASGQLIMVARRLNGIGGNDILTKISLVDPNDREDIQLPPNTKAVRSLCVKPYSRLALLTSLGKKLSVVSTESNNTVLTFDLPVPAWSCSWDIDISHLVYAGLQNGMVMAFDMRQTRTPLESRTGLSSNPVHTVISVAPESLLPSGTRSLLTASQIGMCEWFIGCNEERPYLVPESENQGVCISLAHSGSDDIVASFRPKIEMSTVMPVSQSLPISSMSGGVQGSHIIYKRSGAQNYLKINSLLAQVDSIRLPKSIIINKERHTMFVSANEVTSELVLHDMSNLNVVQRLKTPKNQIWDVRCTQMWNSCVLGCLSGDVMQIYR